MDNIDNSDASSSFETYVFRLPALNNSLRYIDALVHKHVFGNEVLHDGEYYYSIVKGEERFLPHYSSDIAIAWSIMNKLGLTLIPQSDGSSFQWLCCDIKSVFYGGSIQVNPKEGTEFSSKSAPLAICISALQSAGVEVELREDGCLALLTKNYKNTQKP